MLIRTYEYLVSVEAGQLANWLGLALTLIGFTLTIHSVRRSRRAAEKAAEKAAEAARSALSSIRKYDTVGDLSRAIAILEEVKRLQRNQVWPALPERYSALRLLLIAIRSANPHFSDEQETKIQAIITQLSTMESQVEKVLLDTETPIDVARLNRFAAQQMDSLTEILVEVRSEIRDED